MKRIKQRVRHLRALAWFVRVFAVLSLVLAVVAGIVAVALYSTSYDNAARAVGNTLGVTVFQPAREVLSLGLWALFLSGVVSVLVPSVLLLVLSEFLFYMSDDHALLISRRAPQPKPIATESLAPKETKPNRETDSPAVVYTGQPSSAGQKYGKRLTDEERQLKEMRQMRHKGEQEAAKQAKIDQFRKNAQSLARSMGEEL